MMTMRNENVIIEIWSNAYDRMTTMTSIQIYDDDNDNDTDDDELESDWWNMKW